MRQDQWIDMGRTTKHYNKDTLIARKSLRNVVRKQDLICTSCLFGWNKMACQRSPQCKEKNLISPFMSSALDTCTTPFLQACGCTAGEPGTCEVQFNANAPYNQHRKSLSSKLSRAGGPFLALAAARKQRRLRGCLMRARARTTATQRKEVVAQCLMRVATAVYLLLRKSVNG